MSLLYSVGSYQPPHMYLHFNLNRCLLVLMENSLYSLAFNLVVWVLCHTYSSHCSTNNFVLLLVKELRSYHAPSTIGSGIHVTRIPSRNRLVHLRQSFHLYRFGYLVSGREFRNDVYSCLMDFNTCIDHLRVFLHDTITVYCSFSDYDLLSLKGLVRRLNYIVAR